MDARRTAEVIYVGNASDLIRASQEAARATEVTAGKIEGTNAKIGQSYGALVARASEAGKAAAAQAAKLGATLAEQDAAYARSAQAAGLASDKIAAAAKVAGDAAAKQAAAIGGSLNAQSAAYARAARAAGEQATASAAAAKETAAANDKAAAANEAGAARSVKAHEKVIASAGKANETFAKWGTITAAAIIGGAADMAIKVESAATAIAKAGGTGTESGKKIEDAFRTIPGTVEYSAAKIGSAFAIVAGELKVVEGHALGSAEAMKVMKAALDLADASGNDLNSSTEALGKVMMTFHIGAGQAAEGADVLFNAAKATGTSLEDFTTLVDKARGRLGALAPSLKETAGFMAELAKQGVAGRLTMGALGGAFGTLLSQSEKVTSTLKQLGVHVFDHTGKFVGLRSVIEQLHPVLAKYDQASQLAITRTLFGEKANKQLLEVIHQGPAAYDAATHAVSKHGEAAKQAQKEHETLQGKLRATRADLENIGASIGERLLPMFQKLASAIDNAIKWFDKHKDAAKALAIVITTVLGAAVIDFAVTKAARFGKGLESMITGIKALATNSRITATAVEGENAAMVASTEAAAKSMKAALLGAGIVGAIALLATAAFEMRDHWQEVMAAMATATEKAANLIIDALNKAKGVLEGIASGGVIPLLQQLGVLHGSAIPNIPGVSGLPPGSHSGISGNTKVIGPNGEEISLGQFQGSSGAAGRSLSSLKNLGLSETVAQGIIKAMQGETQKNLEKAASEENPQEGAYGIAQWVGPRRAGLESFAKAHHRSKSNLEVQLEYLAHELMTSERGTLEALKHAHGVGEASGIFIKRFERPANAGEVEQRAAGYGTETWSGPGKAAAKVTEAFNKLTGQIEKHTAAGWAHIHALEAQTKAHEKAAKAAEQYVQPFAGATSVTRSRTDQGVDFSFAGKLGAIGPGIIEAIKNFQGFGQTIIERLTSGPHAGQRIYTALETGGAATVHGGQHVAAGQQIARGYGSGGIEMGFAGPEGLPITRYAPGQSHEVPTAGGQAFSKFLASIGHGGGTGSNLQLATSTYETAFKAEQKALAAKLSADTKEGQSVLAKMQAAISSGKLSELVQFVGSAHVGALAKLEGRLSGDHTSALDKLVAKLEQTHTKIFESLRAALYTEFVKWSETIASIHEKMAELAGKAAQVWQAAESKAIALREKTGLAGIEGSGMSGEVKSKRAQDEAEETKHTEEDLAKQLETAKKNLKETKATGDKEKTKEAEHEVRRAEEAITKFARDQDTKRKEDSLSSQRSKVEQEFNLESEALEDRTKAYEAMLNKQLDALTGQLQKAEISYITYAVKVNAILSAAGVAGLGPKDKAAFETLGGVIPYEHSGAHGGFVRVGAPHASGGPVWAGISYMVGEQGPEMFTPSSSGTITPAGKTAEMVGAGNEVHIHGDMNVRNQRDVQKVVDRLAFRMRHG